MICFDVVVLFSGVFSRDCFLVLLLSCDVFFFWRVCFLVLFFLVLLLSRVVL